MEDIAKLTTTEEEAPKLSLSFRKETIKHLKVRTDLRGGLLVQAAKSECCGTHHCRI